MSLFEIPKRVASGRSASGRSSAKAGRTAASDRVGSTVDMQAEPCPDPGRQSVPADHPRRGLYRFLRCDVGSGCSRQPKERNQSGRKHLPSYHWNFAVPKIVLSARFPLTAAITALFPTYESLPSAD